MVTGKKQEGQHADNPREVENTVDNPAGRDKLLTQRESAGPVQWLERRGHAQLDTPPQVQPCLPSWSVRVAVVPPGDHWSDYHTGKAAKGSIQDLLLFL